MKLIFRDKKNETSNIWSFFFEPVNKVEWIAGQSIRLEMKKPTWGIDERRFTIASAPHEKHVRITTRVSDSSFKQALVKLRKGNEIDGHAIEGDFVWGRSTKHRLLLAAGIGINPYRSMLADRIHRKKPINSTLLYGTRDNPILYKTELNLWQKLDPTLSVYYLTDKRLAVDSHSTLAPLWHDSIVYISGPSPMVDQVAKDLVQMGLPETSLRLDWFTGYNSSISDENPFVVV
jgi:ferredoxin-NADP reductase